MSLNHQVSVVVGLGYGDESKAAHVDFLCRQYNREVLVVRFCSGNQAGHNVVTPEGVHHEFNSFGSGTFTGASTFLSKHMLVNPTAIIEEADTLVAKGVVCPLSDKMFISENARVLTPIHAAINKIRESLRGENRHGSCGEGIGELMMDWVEDPSQVLLVHELTDNVIFIFNYLVALRDRKLNEISDVDYEQIDPELIKPLHDNLYLMELAQIYSYFHKTTNIVSDSFLADVLNEGSPVVFEGAQGVLLDENQGFHPYTTWATTTTQNANELLLEANYDGSTHRYGLLRSYATRHGAGPFLTESKYYSDYINDVFNPENEWQQAFRSGMLDLVTLRYATDVCDDIDSLVISHVDELVKFRVPLKLCTNYRLPDDTIINSIVFNEPVDFKVMEKFVPVYLAYKPMTVVSVGQFYNHNNYLKAISRSVGIPISYLGYGPTANDRVKAKL